MNDFLSKLENFLFDILGLILPGAIFLLILMSPLLVVDLDQMPAKIVDSSIILSALKTISNILKDYWTTYPKSVLIIAAILAYLIGHTVKIFSILKYSFLVALFDRSLNKLIITAFNRIKNRIFSEKARKSNTYIWVKDIFKPFKIVIGDIFIFKPDYHDKKEEIIMQNCVNILSTRTSMIYPKDDYLVGKISGVIANQEGFRTLGTFFLAKYNLYRSLSLIFLFATFYCIYFFKIVYMYIKSSSCEVSIIIPMIAAILWYTFHVKYKRYWTLYGNERIISLFYFLNKKKINEA